VNGGTRVQSLRRSSCHWTSTAHRARRADVTLPCNRLHSSVQTFALAPSDLRAIWNSATDGENRFALKPQQRPIHRMFQEMHAEETLHTELGHRLKFSFIVAQIG
jgi:hypothetical protein